MAKRMVNKVKKVLGKRMFMVMMEKGGGERRQKVSLHGRLDLA